MNKAHSFQDMSLERRQTIYLDYQATTPLEPTVLAAMMPYLTGQFGNPHSSTHRFGWEGMAGVDVARDQVASVIGADPEEVIFLSGATEANNLALIGALEAAPRERKKLITLATEHSCVLETARYLAQRRGYDVTILPVLHDGLVNLDRLDSLLDEQVALVSIMTVNNEIGTIQPIAEIGRRAKAVGALFHTDAAQAFGKIPLNVQAQQVDLMSLSAHKIYGPKGIGALYVRKGTAIAPQVHGGGQERGIRSGTLAPHQCVGFGEAARMALERMETDLEHVEGCWRQMVDALAQAGLEFQINGSEDHRFKGNLNLSFFRIDGARLLADLRGFAVSSGAACASAVGKPSYVLEALGVTDSLAKATLRIGFGRQTTQEHVALAAEALIKAIRAQHEETWRS